MKPETATVDGLTIAASCSGARGGASILLLHGWPHCRALYEGVLDGLGEHAYTIALDLPGTGDSRGAPRSAEKHVLAGLALDAAEQLGAVRPLVAGIDVGGMIAFAAARDHGARITGAMVMNTAVPGVDPWDEVLANPAIWHFAFHQVPHLPEALVGGREEAYFDFFIDTLAGDAAAVDAGLRGAFVHAYRQPGALRSGFDWYRTMPADAERNRTKKDIEVPILYLRGDASHADPDAYTRGLQAAGARRVTAETIADAGEFLPVENPAAFVEAVTRFARATAHAEG